MGALAFRVVSLANACRTLDVAAPSNNARRDIMLGNSSFIIERHPFCKSVLFKSIYRRCVTTRHTNEEDGRQKQRNTNPAATATNCLPSTVKVMGDAFIPTLVSKCHKMSPLRSSTATKAPLGSP